MCGEKRVYISIGPVVKSHGFGKLYLVDVASGDGDYTWSFDRSKALLMSQYDMMAHYVPAVDIVKGGIIKLADSDVLSVSIHSERKPRDKALAGSSKNATKGEKDTSDTSARVNDTFDPSKISGSYDNSYEDPGHYRE